MRRGTIFPILFVIISAAIIGLSMFISSQNPDANTPIQLSLAVSPLAESWMEQAIQDFNATNTQANGRTVSISLTSTIDDTQAWSEWSAINHPNIWIPAAKFSINVSSTAFDVLSNSVAQTPIIWMGYESRVQALTNDGIQRFDWGTVIEAAELESWGAISSTYSNLDFINIAFAPPDKDITGLSVLFSAAADTDSAEQVTESTLRGTVRTRLIPVLNALQTYIGSLESYVARPSTVHLAIGAESIWLNNLNNFTRNEDVTFSYPSYTVMMDFPVAIWSDSTSAERDAAQAFIDWLLLPAQQAKIPSYGLRPVIGTPTISDRLFANAQVYGIELSPIFDHIVQPQVSSNDIQALLAWFSRRG